MPKRFAPPSVPFIGCDEFSDEAERAWSDYCRGRLTFTEMDRIWERIRQARRERDAARQPGPEHE
jgi:hypothetical protein